MKKFFEKMLNTKSRSFDRNSKGKNESNVDLVRFEFRKQFLELQKQHLREKIVSELAYLKDEVNVEAILADLGEKYISRSDLESVSLQSNYDAEPMLLLSFTHENSSNRERVDRFVPLFKYSTLA